MDAANASVPHGDALSTTRLDDEADEKYYCTRDVYVSWAVLVLETYVQPLVPAGT